MGYKMLGFIVWQVGKWYVRRRLRDARRDVALTAIVALVLGGLLAASRQRLTRR